MTYHHTESTSYTTTNSKLKYSTISTTAYGGIDQLSLTDTGGGYLSIPGITITSDVGNGAVLESFSNNIGKVTKTTLQNIGFDYPSDSTLLPEVIFPQVLRITPLTGFKSIGITSIGKGYIQNPNLVVIDGVTKKQIKDIIKGYRPDELFVEILDNTESMNDTTPTIIPTGNPNGIRVSNLVYDNDEQQLQQQLKMLLVVLSDIQGLILILSHLQLVIKCSLKMLVWVLDQLHLDLTHQGMIMQDLKLHR